MVGIVVKLGAGASNPYTIAFLATAVATGMRWLLDPWLGDHIPFTPYYAAICVSGLLGGASSAILTLLAGLVLGNLLFIAPRGLLLISGQEQIIGVLAYLMVGCSTSIRFEGWRQLELQGPSSGLGSCLSSVG